MPLEVALVFAAGMILGGSLAGLIGRLRHRHDWRTVAARDGEYRTLNGHWADVVETGDGPAGSPSDFGVQEFTP